MDSFFGIGAPELFLILLLAGIVMGPQRISKVARWLGQTTARLQGISRQFMRQLNTELAAADEGRDIQGAMEDIQSLRNQVNELRQELLQTTKKPLEETKTAVRESQKLLQQAVSLTDERPEGSENRIAPPPPVKLPNRVEVPDDPE